MDELSPAARRQPFRKAMARHRRSRRAQGATGDSEARARRDTRNGED